MSDKDQALLKAFAENKQMFDAVRRALLVGLVGEDFDKRNWVFGIDAKQSDSAYGKQVKIATKALEWINAGFNDIARLATSTIPQPAPKNEAR